MAPRALKLAAVPISWAVSVSTCQYGRDQNGGRWDATPIVAFGRAFGTASTQVPVGVANCRDTGIGTRRTVRGQAKYDTDFVIHVTGERKAIEPAFR